jgi:NAD(P)-dependent dehydrogenase (short-subunit alcohol dehydrogenase family)
VVVGDIDRAGLEALANADDGGSVRGVHFDLADDVSIADLVERAVTQMGGLDAVAIPAADTSLRTRKADVDILDMDPVL